MQLTQEQDFVYLWRYKGSFAGKIGVSTGKSFITRIDAAETNSHLDIEILGIQLHSSRLESVHREQTLLNTFTRIRPDREWVYLTQDVWKWIETECEAETPTYQQFVNLNGRIERSRTKRKERLKDPSFRAAENARSRRQQARARADPVRNAKINARRRERYANDPEYRQKRTESNKKQREQRRAQKPQGKQLTFFPLDTLDDY